MSVTSLFFFNDICIHVEITSTSINCASRHSDFVFFALDRVEACQLCQHTISLYKKFITEVTEAEISLTYFTLFLDSVYYIYRIEYIIPVTHILVTTKLPIGSQCALHRIYLLLYEPLVND